MPTIAARPLASRTKSLAASIQGSPSYTPEAEPVMT
jgi:hypothetical protein